MGGVSCVAPLFRIGPLYYTQQHSGFPYITAGSLASGGAAPFDMPESLSQ
jgi:hypothetical protein